MLEKIVTEVAIFLTDSSLRSWVDRITPEQWAVGLCIGIPTIVGLTIIIGARLNNE